VESTDILIIGSGIAGAATAAFLGQGIRVTIVEAEPRPGFHATGRSAALFVPNYGPPAVRALTRASKAFFSVPPVVSVSPWAAAGVFCMWTLNSNRRQSRH
jgi:D-arginine dehydrogenase